MVLHPRITTVTKTAIRLLGFTTIPPTTSVASPPHRNSLTNLAPKSLFGPRATRSETASRPSSTTRSTAPTPKGLEASGAAPPESPNSTGNTRKPPTTGGARLIFPNLPLAPASATRSGSLKTRAQVHPPGSPTISPPSLTKRKCLPLAKSPTSIPPPFSSICTTTTIHSPPD